ncbi:hypothetical protein L3X38_000028, partial [Prunus dulcis]
MDSLAPPGCAEGPAPRTTHDLGSNYNKPHPCRTARAEQTKSEAPLTLADPCAPASAPTALPKLYFPAQASINHKQAVAKTCRTARSSYSDFLAQSTLALLPSSGRLAEAMPCLAEGSQSCAKAEAQPPRTPAALPTAPLPVPSET